MRKTQKTFISKVRRSGNSLIFVIPKYIREALNIEEGKFYEVQIIREVEEGGEE